MAKYFGTDGIRGKVGTPPLTPDGVRRFGAAVAGWLKTQAVPDYRTRHLVLIGGDTRSSTPWIVEVLSGTLNAHGFDVAQLGTATTPQTAFETRANRGSAGIMVTASHNTAADNGLKLFGPDGFKLSAGDEAAIEALMDTPETASVGASEIGQTALEPNASAYLRAMESSGTAGLGGLKIVLDTAHGAACRIAPRILEVHGAELELIGAEPDGLNINDGVGATHTDALAARVVEAGAYAGVALDGDADRLIMVDETGTVIDGDQLIALIARDLHARGELKGGAVAATVMSNLGLERFLEGLGVELVRTPVGDKHVVEAMRARGLNLGGEQSGHIVMLDRATTGDGLAAALAVLSAAHEDGRAFSQIARVFEAVPQELVNVRFEGENPLEQASVQAAIAEVEAGLGDGGRVLVRKSGTEPLIRIMVEAIDHEDLKTAIAQLEQAVQSAMAG